MFRYQRVPITVDLVEALCMAAAKTTVSICAHRVHRHLSPVGAHVCRCWVMVLAASKVATGAAVLCLAGFYFSVGVLGRTPLDCSVWLLLNCCYLGVVLSQSLAALALFRIHERAVAYSGDPEVRSEVNNSQ